MEYFVKDTLGRILICRKCSQPLVTDYDSVKCGCGKNVDIYVMPEDKMLKIKKETEYGKRERN